jgi:hypothetical protein
MPAGRRACVLMRCQHERNNSLRLISRLSPVSGLRTSLAIHSLNCIYSYIINLAIQISKNERSNICLQLLLPAPSNLLRSYD